MQRARYSRLFIVEDVDLSHSCRRITIRYMSASVSVHVSVPLTSNVLPPPRLGVVMFRVLCLSACEQGN